MTGPKVSYPSSIHPEAKAEIESIFQPQTIPKAIKGGFTAIQKYKFVSNEGRICFLKYAPNISGSTDAKMTEFEGRVYEVINSINSLGGVFPRFFHYNSNDRFVYLVIEAIDDARWGVVETESDIDKLVQALSVLHSTPINEALQARISRIDDDREQYLVAHGGKIRPRKKHLELLQRARSKTGLRDYVTGADYIELDPKIFEEIIEASLSFDDQGAFVMRDLNFGNFGIRRNGAVLVDPAFAGFGSEDLDTVSLVLNIFYAADPNNEHLIGYAESLLTNIEALKYKTGQLLASGATSYDKDNQTDVNWIRYHQKIAQLAYRLLMERC